MAKVKKTHFWRDLIKIVLLWAVAAPVLYVAWQLFSQTTLAAEKSETSPATIARFVCMESIKPNLHDPSSADWGPMSDTAWQRWPATQDGDTYKIAPAFRAKSKIGATVLSQWSCTVKIGEEGPTLVSLSEL